MLFSVAELSQELQVNSKTIYRCIDKMSDEQLSIAIIKQKNANGRMTKYITKDGFYIILDMLDPEEVEKPLQMPLNAPQSDFNTNTLIETLQEQLKAKDGQIQALQEQINSLLTQCSNYQQLLQNQQFLSLPQKKQNIFKRLFSRSADE